MICWWVGDLFSEGYLTRSCHHRRRGVAALLGYLFSCTLAPDAVGLPPGSAWTPVETLRFSDSGFVVPDRLYADSAGAPFLVGSNLGRPHRNGVFRWTGDRWALASERPRLAEGPIWPVVSTTRDQYVIWQEFPDPEDETGRIALVRLSSYSIAEVESVTSVRLLGTFSYAATVSPRRRWVGVGEEQYRLRVFYSDPGGPWKEVPDIAGDALNGMTCVALDDTTAMFVWANKRENRLYWGVLRGSRWSQALLPEPQQNASLLPLEPRMLRRGSWLYSITTSWKRCK